MADNRGILLQMLQPGTPPEYTREFGLKWEMGVRGASGIIAALEHLDAKVQLGRMDIWFDGRAIMGVLLAARLDESAPIAVRTSGADAEKAMAELAAVFECDMSRGCSCGEKTRLIGWDAHGAEFVCSKGHVWSTRRN